MTDEELQEIEHRIKSATPGPWRVANFKPPRYKVPYSRIAEVGCVYIDSTYPNDILIDDEKNAQFIVNCREDIEKLLKETKQLRELLSNLKNVVKIK